MKSIPFNTLFILFFTNICYGQIFNVTVTSGEVFNNINTLQISGDSLIIDNENQVFVSIEDIIKIEKSNNSTTFLYGLSGGIIGAWVGLLTDSYAMFVTPIVGAMVAAQIGKKQSFKAYNLTNKTISEKKFIIKKLLLEYFY